MRAAAQVVPVAVIIDRNILIGRNAFDQFRLILLANVLEMLDRLVARPDFAAGGPRLATISCIFGFDLWQVLGREGLIAGEVVIKTSSIAGPMVTWVPG